MQAIQPLNLPPPGHLSIRDGANHREIFDPIRGKWVRLTVEEWVRQCFVAWLTDALGYPKSIIANEMSLTLNRTRRRADTVIFDCRGKPIVIIEYKAPSVEITQSVFDQIVRYNITLHARYLVVSNGITHYCCRLDYSNGTPRATFLDTVPHYRDIIET